MIIRTLFYSRINIMPIIYTSVLRQIKCFIYKSHDILFYLHPFDFHVSPPPSMSHCLLSSPFHPVLLSLPAHLHLAAPLLCAALTGAKRIL